MALTVILGPVATARLHDLPLAPLPRAIDHGLAAQARAGRRGGLALGAVLALGALAATPAEAATITVDTFAIDQVAGDGDCDIFEAVANANNNADGTSGDCVAGDPGLDTIVFDGSLSQSTVAMGGNTLVVSEDLVLDGSGVAVLDGEGTDQIIYAPADLTVRNIGFVYGSYLAGGAIGAYGELTVENAEFAYNESVFPGGALIANEGVSVSDSNFVGNFAKYVGGGAVAAFGDSGTFTNVYAFGNGSVYGVGGALLLAQGDHAISGGVFAFNQATSGGAIAAGEVYNAGGPGNRKGLPPVPLALTISISGGDFYNNQANGNSGGQGPQLKLPVSS